MGRLSKCQLCCSYFLLWSGILGALGQIYMIMTLDDWSEFVIPAKEKSMTIKLNTSQLFLICVLKLVSSALCIRWGRQGIKTFKPILKEQREQRTAEIVPPTGSTYK